IYETETGIALLKAILEPKLPYTPHDYTIAGIATVLDGNDLVTIAPTGSGKTTFFTGLILALRELAAHPERCLKDRMFPKKPPPPPIVSYSSASAGNTLGVDALVINADTISEAAARNQNLWDAAVDKPSVVILSPEQLRTEGFGQLLANKVFFARIAVLGIDELHLLFHWGKTFRPAFVQIGQVRHRLPHRERGRTLVLGLTATLRAGDPWNMISESLAFESNTLRIIHQSNRRPNVQFIFRPLSSGIAGVEFPDLDWVLESGRRTVIFCKTVSLSFRVACHLMRKAHTNDWTKILDKIRLYTSLYDFDFNHRTLELMEAGRVRVVVSTDALSVGWNPPGILDVIIFGDIEDPDELLQR
ncbi:P-loop containing nucleoside triphosphate hydrolase protein, partial [Mycena amicta]